MMKLLRIPLMSFLIPSIRSPQKLEVGTNGRYASISLASAGIGRAALHNQVRLDDESCLPGWATKIISLQRGEIRYYSEGHMVEK